MSNQKNTNMPKKKTLIDTAIESLKIQAVFLTSSTSDKKGGFSPSKHDGEMQLLSFNGTESCKLAESDDNDEYKYAYIYTFTAGVRLLDNADKDILAQIEAKFEAIYVSKKELEKKCLKEFGNKNVQIHVWPYWREYVQSTCTRMGIDTIPIPLYAIKDSKKKQLAI